MNASSVHKISRTRMALPCTNSWLPIGHLVNGPWAESIASARLSVEEMQGWILHIYPFIYDFPKFSREALIKCGGRLLPHLSDREYPYRKGARRALAMDGRGFRLGPAADAGLAEGGLLSCATCSR